MANIVAIVGRPNVGKSTLFNRLVGRRQAIMDNESGITRDRHYGHAEWNGKYFTVIDTGGFLKDSDDVFDKAIRDQVKMAIEEASAIIFMVDTFTGIMDTDKDFANIIRQYDKPVLLVANKADNIDRVHMANEFYELAIGEIYPVSSQTGSGTGELLDDLVKTFPDEGIEDPDEGIPKISVLGRPNVGKSSFVNVLLQKDRSIVTDIAGTTRDAINSRYTLYGQEFIIVDTAGIRKKAKIKEGVEFYSTLRALNAMEDSDVCILMVDATRGLESQDLNIIRQAQMSRKGIVILVNKWDLIEKTTKTAREFELDIQQKLAPNDYIPIIFTSAITKQRVYKAVEKTIEVYNNLTKKISTSQLNDKILPEIERYPPPAYKGKYIKIKYITQLPTKRPTIAFFCNLPQYIKEPYERYLENRIRDHFDFEGVPLKLVFRKK